MERMRLAVVSLQTCPMICIAKKKLTNDGYSNDGSYMIISYKIFQPKNGNVLQHCISIWSGIICPRVKQNIIVTVEENIFLESYSWITVSHTVVVEKRCHAHPVWRCSVLAQNYPPFGKSFPYQCMYGTSIFFVYRKNQPNVGKIYHTWILWNCVLSRCSGSISRSTMNIAFASWI